LLPATFDAIPFHFCFLGTVLLQTAFRASAG
jgi:hypothetical protein